MERNELEMIIFLRCIVVELPILAKVFAGRLCDAKGIRIIRGQRARQNPVLVVDVPDFVDLFASVRLYENPLLCACVNVK